MLVVMGILIAGGLLCALTWHLMKGLPAWLRLLPSTLIVAFTIAPGVVVGHGFAIVPVTLVLADSVASADWARLYSALLPVLVEWAVIYSLSLLVVFFRSLLARIGKVAWLVPAGLLLAAAAITPLGSRIVNRRVTSIDLSGIYTNIQSYNEGRDGFVLRAGNYPSSTGTAFYYLKTPRGSILLVCCLEDQDAWIASRRRWEVGPTSQSIGDESFFKNETGSGDMLELAYRRLNVGVCFRSSPKREYRLGLPVFTPEQDKWEMLEAAQILEQAILEKQPSVQFEEIRLRHDVARKVEDSLRYFLWMFYFFAHPY